MDINRQAPVTASHKIVINAPGEIVWDILTNVNSWAEWNPHISKANLEGEFAPDSVFRWKSGGFGVLSTIREVTPRSRIVWTGTAFGVKAVHVWNLTAQSGGVSVETEESFEGWLVGLMKGSMKKTLDSALTVWLESLKKKAEISNF